MFFNAPLPPTRMNRRAADSQTAGYAMDKCYHLIIT